MGYVFEFIDAVNYERRLSISKNRFALDLECRILNTLLNPARRETLLDIGCGTGSVLLFLLNQGLQVTGIDPSPYMLDIAKKTVGNRADLHRGFAEDLPFEDNSFNYTSLFTTLEFVNDPQKALEEAFRVSKDKVFIGALNHY
ncbi:MAG: class I SAM-dependent methyltransferase, partial [Thermodesulfobacteriota bacterium]